jgi:hypothetical protein
MTALVTTARDRLDAVFALAKKQRADEETLSHWARYLCVLTSGYVEVALRSVLGKYVSVRSHPDVVNYVESKLERITNLNEETIFQLLGSFRPAWAELFRKSRSDAQKDALDSVVANRNQIAHGHSVGLTLARMAEYYREIVTIVNIIERVCVR